MNPLTETNGQITQNSKAARSSDSSKSSSNPTAHPSPIFFLAAEAHCRTCTRIFAKERADQWETHTLMHRATESNAHGAFPCLMGCTQLYLANSRAQNYHNTVVHAHNTTARWSSGAIRKKPPIVAEKHSVEEEAEYDDEEEVESSDDGGEEKAESSDYMDDDDGDEGDDSDYTDEDEPRSSNGGRWTRIDGFVYPTKYLDGHPKCESCNQSVLSNRTILTEHARKHDNQTGGGQWSCDKCKIGQVEFYFDDLASLEKHKRQLHSEVTADEMVAQLSSTKEKTTAVNDGQLEHIDPFYVHDKKYHCTICDESIKSHKFPVRSRYLHEHLRMHNSTMADGKWPCTDCPNLWFPTENRLFHSPLTHFPELHWHNVRHHPLKKSIYPVNAPITSPKQGPQAIDPTVDNERQCRYCHKKFSQKTSRQTHELTHTRDHKFECDYCHKTFAQLTSKQYHERTHTGEKPVKCRYCDEGFIAHWARTAHEKKVHDKGPGRKDKRTNNRGRQSII